MADDPKAAKTRTPRSMKKDEEPTVDNPGDCGEDIKVSQQPPTKADLQKTAYLPVLTADGKSVPFKSLYTNKDGSPRRVLILFIRHFFCGNCQEFIRTLSSSITPSALAALPTPAEIVIVGCGQPDVISYYAQTVATHFPIYADPSKRLYDLLHMGRTLSLGPSRPDYMQQSLPSVILQSFWASLTSKGKIFRAGDFSQVGGEFLFEGGEVAWCHRMQNTRDHAEIPEIRARLGLDDERPPMRNKRWSVAGTGLVRSLSSKRQSWSRSRSRGDGGGRRRMDRLAEEGKERVVDGSSPPQKSEA